jgi:chromosome segregation ATPase
MDLGSSNGTKVNSMAINPQEDIKLRSGDEVLIGKLSLQYSNKNLVSIQDKSFSIIHQKKNNLISRNEITIDPGYDGSIKMGAKYENMEVEEEEVPGRHESEKLLEKKVRTYIAALEKVESKNNIVEKRIARRIEVEAKIKSMESEHKEILDSGAKNKDLWRKHSKEWKDIHDDIENLKKEIEKKELVKENLAKIMDASDAYNKVINMRSDLLIEIKALGRERLDEKNIRYQEDIKEKKAQIRREERKIKMLQADKKLKKAEEKKQIEQEIKALQDKLKSAS